MAYSFGFIRDIFPEIAEDAEKAESYLHTDSAACTLYISRVLDGIIKTACKSGNIPLKADGKERGLAELIDELSEKHIADRRTVRTLHSMRIFRNKNAHNEDTSPENNKKLIRQARDLCKWLARITAQNRISITDIIQEYKKDPRAAGRKYEGRTLTLTGGKVLKVQRSAYGNGALAVTLVSSPLENASGYGSTTYKADCLFPMDMEARINSLKPGQNFTATGIWERNRLVNCVWQADHPKYSRNRRREWNGKDAWFWFVFTIIVLSCIYHVLYGNY